MSPSPKLSAVVLAAAMIAASGAASARSSDRNQQMQIGADYSSCGLGDNTSCTLTGNVTITQGTLNVAASKAVLTQLDGDPSRVLLSGGVTLKQQLDDGNDIDASATNVDYNLKTEVVVFTGNVLISRARGTLKGQRIVYNMKTAQVEGGDGSAAGRVRMTIQPKSAQKQPAPPKASN